MSKQYISRCGCGEKRPRSCLNSVYGSWPYYGGKCPDAEGDYEDCRRNCCQEDDCCEERCDDRCDDRGECRRRRRHRHGAMGGIFTTSIPVAVAANGVIPLNGCCIENDLRLNGGVVTITEPGNYLATVTARVPEGVTVATTVTMNANDASQYSSLMVLGGAGPASSSAQAIFEVNDRTSVSLISSEALNITEASPQPLFTLSIVRID